MPSTITTPNTIIGFLPDGKPVYEIRGGAPEEGETPADPAPETPEGQEPTGETEAVEDPKDKEIKRLRGEAAGWRTQLRDAQAQLSNAKTPEDIAAAVAEVEAKLAEKDAEIFTRDRALVIAQHKLPKELADLLPTTGKTVEELDALAAGLAKFVPATTPEADDLDGGLTPAGKKSSNADVAASIRARRGRRF